MPKDLYKIVEKLKSKVLYNIWLFRKDNPAITNAALVPIFPLD